MPWEQYLIDFITPEGGLFIDKYQNYSIIVLIVKSESSSRLKLIY